MVYNNAVHSSTGFTPFKVATGLEFMSMPEDPQEPPSLAALANWVDSFQSIWGNLKQALDKTTESQKKQTDKRRAPQGAFHVGDRMYLSTKYLNLRLPCKKLGPKYIGLFPIVKVINPVTVGLKLPRILGKVHPVFHCKLLNPVYGSRMRPVEREALGPIMVGGNEHYEIKQILDFRIHKGRLQYLVQWRGYPISETRWTKAHHVKADHLVTKFHTKYPQKPRPPG